MFFWIYKTQDETKIQITYVIRIDVIPNGYLALTGSVVIKGSLSPFSLTAVTRNSYSSPSSRFFCSRLRIIRSDVPRNLRPFVGTFRFLFQDIAFNFWSSVVFWWFPLYGYGCWSCLEHLQRALGWWWFIYERKFNLLNNYKVWWLIIIF